MDFHRTTNMNFIDVQLNKNNNNNNHNDLNYFYETKNGNSMNDEIMLYSAVVTICCTNSFEMV